MTNSKPKATARSTTAKPQRMQAEPTAAKTAKQNDPKSSRQPSKLGVIRILLAGANGATLDELVSATGWQPHSVRSGMTGLRKQGLLITRAKAGGTTRFAIETQPVEVTA